MPMSDEGYIKEEWFDTRRFATLPESAAFLSVTNVRVVAYLHGLVLGKSVGRMMIRVPFLMMVSYSCARLALLTM